MDQELVLQITNINSTSFTRRCVGVYECIVTASSRWMRANGDMHEARKIPLDRHEDAGSPLAVHSMRLTNKKIFSY